MRTMIVGATVFVVGVGAPAAWAANGPDTTGNNIFLQGSDTLEEVTKAVLAVCPNAVADGITYAGGGSGTGETAMSTTPPTQKVAPMSRFINPSTATCAKGRTTEGLVIGLDGLAVVASTASSTAGTCGGGLAFTGTIPVTDVGGNPVVNCPGCDPGTSNYVIGGPTGGTGNVAGWRDTLRLIFAGVGHDGTRDCAGNVRRSLVKNWNNLFQGHACASGTCPQGLKHAFRRGDASGTTDVFLASMGAPLAGLASGQIAKGKPAINWFCNAFPLKDLQPPPYLNSDGTVNNGQAAADKGKSFGGASDYMDGDPVRISCDTTLDTEDTGNLLAGEQACNYGGVGPVGTNGTLGLVQVIEVPTNLDANALYNVPACTPGKFGLALPKAGSDTSAGYPNSITPCPNGATSCPCPNGGKLVGLSCWFPFQDLGGGARNFNCINEQQFVQGPVKNGITDGRAYNLFARNANGNYVKDGFSVPEDPSAFATGDDTDLSTRMVTNAAFRMHVTLAGTGGGSSCQKADSTAQIGCLTQADKCTIGYAGREADTVNTGVAALTVNGIADTAANIAKILGPTDPTQYPIARKLFFNTLFGFENINGGELELAKCMGNSATINPIVGGKGFIPMNDPTVIPFNAGGKPICQDLDETLPAPGCALPGPNVNACATIPAGLIQ